MKITAVIPVLNEEKYIAGVVKTTRQYVNTVLVTDGGSTDNTVMLAQAAGAKVISRQTKGLGENLVKGLNIAVNGKDKPDIVVLLDGDGQHNPDEIPELLKPIIGGRADVVVGNRRVVKGMPPYRLFGNGILSAFVNYRASYQVTDAMVGFWVLKRVAIPKLTEPGWACYVEMLIKVRASGQRLMSIPIQPIYHAKYADNSTLPPLNLGIRLLWAIIKWRLICEVWNRIYVRNNRGYWKTRDIATDT